MIVGSHGAAFSNIAFSEPGTVFIEFFVLGHFNRAFSRIATLKSMKYGFIFGKKDGLGMIVEPAQLHILIEKVLST